MCQSIINAKIIIDGVIEKENDTYKVEMVIGSKEGIYGLERAKNAGIKAMHIKDEDLLIETLKEKVRVKLKDGEGFFYKKYDAKDIKVIKDIEAKEEEN